MNYADQHVDTASLSRAASGAAGSGTAPDGFSLRSASRSFADQAMIDALSPDGGIEPAETRATEQLLGPPRNTSASGPTRRTPQYPYLNWRRPIEFWRGSVNQAASANPMSAMPSTVPSSGKSWISTPCARSSATSLAMSATRQEALAASSAVPVVLLVTISRLLPPHLKVRNCSSSSSTSSPSVPRFGLSALRAFCSSRSCPGRFLRAFFNRAVCVAGRRDGPAEDCGGVYAYELISAATDPGNPDHVDAVAEFDRFYGESAAPESMRATP